MQNITDQKLKPDGPYGLKLYEPNLHTSVQMMTDAKWGQKYTWPLASWAKTNHMCFSSTEKMVSIRNIITILAIQTM